VKDQSQRETFTRSKAADSMAHVNPMHTPGAWDRAMVDSENHRIALGKRHHLGTRLRAWPLLGQHEFPARKIRPRR
jgi:hypothetical protein